MRPLLFAAALSLLAISSANAAPEQPARDCFRNFNWQGWSPSSEGDSLYLRVGRNEVYQVELTPGSRVRRGPGRFLINRSRGNGFVCSPLDLDLSLADHLGFERPLFPQSIRRLSEEEVAALPASETPH